MKKNYKLKLFAALIVAGVSIGGANAFNPNLTSTTIVAESSDNWVTVQEENGITVSFSEYEINGVTYLKVKLENTTANTVSLSVDLKKKSEILVEDYSTELAPQSSIELTDYNSIVIPIHNGETYQDISIVTNFK